MRDNSEKILLLATAPMGVVAAVAGQVAERHPGAKLSMLIKSSSAAAAEGRFPEWTIAEYGGGPVSPWNNTLPPLDDLRHAAAEGVYYACNFVAPDEYLNVELFARLVNPTRCFSMTSHGIVESIPIPEEALTLIADGDEVGAKEKMLDFARRRSIEFSVKSTTAVMGPRSAAIFLTERCNYKCVMCAFHSEEMAEKYETLKDWLPLGAKELEHGRALTLIDELAAAGVGAITLSGYGETLLYNNIDQLIRRIRGHGVECNMFTNGSLIGPDKRRMFIDEGLSRINISLNASSPEGYAEIHKIAPEGFSAVVANVKALVSERDAAGAPGPTVGISFVITKSNKHEIESMFQTAQDAGVDNVMIIGASFAKEYNMTSLALDADEKMEILARLKQIRAVPSSGGKMDILLSLNANWNKVYDEGTYYKNNQCYYGWYFTAVSPSGMVLPCCACGKSLGNVYKSSFDRIWNGPEYIALREEMRELPQKQKSIEGCYCFSGCPHIISNETIVAKVREFDKYGGSYFGE